MPALQKTFPFVELKETWHYT